MKFIYLATKVLPQGVDENWVTRFLPEEAVKDLLSLFLYKKVYIKIAPETDPDDTFYVGIEQVDNIPKVRNLTIGQVFLKDFTSNPFVPETEVPVGMISYVQLHNAREEQYLILADSSGVFTPSNPFKEPTDTPDILTPIKDLPDLLLARPRYLTDMSRIHTHALITVNGFLHQTALAEDTTSTVFIKEGGRTSHVSGYGVDGTEVDILSFENIAAIDKFSLSSLLLTPDDDDGYDGKVEIGNIPVDLTDKSILLSLGGYLVYPEAGLLEIVDNNTVSIDLSRLNIANRILESSKYLDLSSLDLIDVLEDISDPDLSDIITDDVLRAYLELSQSFLIVVPKKRCIVYSTSVRRFNDERKIQTNYRPRAIFPSKIGRILSYWVQTNHNLGKRIHYTVLIRGREVDVELSRSETYKFLKDKFPEVFPEKQTFKDVFTSLGFYSITS